MTKIVSITSQGQITIPASIRRLFSLDRYHKALVKVENNRIVVEPVSDILSLAGYLKEKAKTNKAPKKKKIDEIIKAEEETPYQIIKKI